MTPRTDLLWYAIDFDGTIVETEPPAYIPLNPPIKGVMQKMYEIRDMGYKIVIHTARPWADYEIIENYLRWHKLPFHSIVCGKLLAKKYIDDRNGPAVHEESWL